MSVYNMLPTRVLVLALVTGAAAAVRAVDHYDLYNMTDEEYYAMPQLFQLDEYNGCLAARGVYCLGSFELSAPPTNQLFRKMQVYSSDWVQHFNHTRLHRGFCLSRRCPQLEHDNTRTSTYAHTMHAWFASCVNASTTAEYSLSARLYHVDYCTRGQRPVPVGAGDRAFAVSAAVLLTLALISTTLDVAFSHYNTKGVRWALSWSVRQSWRALTAPAQLSPDNDLRFLDGLRVFSMLCIIIEHVGWLATMSYIADTRFYEQKRRAGDFLLLTNSTLVVQVFFIMSSFLMAHKLLRQEHVPPVKTFIQTMLNRFVRLSPSYFVVFWFTATWWEHTGSGPLWSPMVRAEAAVCRRKWWMHLFYVNNFNYTDKCLTQTWYLATDMQMYAAALLLMLVLRGRRALPALGVLLVAATVLPFALSYTWNLMPTYVLHRPEAVRRVYNGDDSFNLLYQSPVGNAFAALMGLLVAHAHHALSGSKHDLSQNKVFCWASILAIPGTVMWAALSPRLLAPGPPPRLGAALLAAFERPVFDLLAAFGIFGALQGVDSPLRKVLSRPGGTVMARLSFGALLLHIPINKAVLGARLGAAQIDRLQFFFEFFGVTAMSYTLAVPLALLVELPAQRLYRELSGAAQNTARAPHAPPVQDKPLVKS